MVNLTINVEDIGAVADPGDYLLLSAPRFRERSGKVVSTAPRKVELTNGRAVAQVHPGPLQVEFRCRNLADSEPRIIEVPEDGGELAVLMRDAYTYAPPVIAAAQSAAASAAATAAEVVRITDETIEQMRVRGEAMSASSAAVAAATEQVAQMVEDLRRQRAGEIAAGSVEERHLSSSLDTLIREHRHDLSTINGISSALSRTSFSEDPNTIAARNGSGAIRVETTTAPKDAVNVETLGAELEGYVPKSRLSDAAEGATGTVVTRAAYGHIRVPNPPKYADSAAPKGYVDSRISATMGSAEHIQEAISAADRLEAAVGNSQAQRYDKVLLGDGADLNELTTPGVYPVRDHRRAVSLKHGPSEFPDALTDSSIEVQISSRVAVIQTWRSMPAADQTPLVLHRQKDSGGPWGPWREVAPAAAPPPPPAPVGPLWNRGEIAKNTDLDTVLEPGAYKVQGYAFAKTLQHAPSGDALTDASLTVYDSGRLARFQEWRSMPNAAEPGLVLHRHRDSAGTWSEWSAPAGAATAAPAAAPKILQTNDDLDTLEPGDYQVGHHTVGRTLKHTPPEPAPSNPGLIRVEEVPLRKIKQQTWYSFPPVSGDAPVYRRWQDTSKTWSPWRSITEAEHSAVNDLVELSKPLALALTTEAAGTRAVLRKLSGEAAPIWAWYGGPGDRLTIPTHEGSGQVCHPCVLHFPDRWHGYEYWMAMTPYPHSEEGHEDPNIVASHDGLTWEVPAGLTNPLDDQPGKPVAHNSDTHLLVHEGTMICTWRMVDRSYRNQNIIHARTSPDGVTWTPRVEVLKVPLDNHRTFVAQSLIKMPTGWRLYGINASGNSSQNPLVYYDTTVETLPTTSDWSGPHTCTVTGIRPDRDPWHSEVQRLGPTDWLATIADGDRGTTGVNGDVLLARSSDGVTWECSPLPAVPRLDGTVNNLYKSGFVVSGSGDERKVTLYYSGYRTSDRRWKTSRSTCVLH